MKLRRTPLTVSGVFHCLHFSDVARFPPVPEFNEHIDDTESNDVGARIKQAMAAEGLTHYTMSLVGGDVQAVIEAVNIGIDAHLTACFCPERGDSYEVGSRTITATEETTHWKKGDTLTLAHSLECKVSADSLPVLLRRLDESDDEAAAGLRSAILSTLGLEE